MPDYYGTIATAGEVDSYTVSLVAGRTYYLEMVGDDRNGAALPDAYQSLVRSGIEVAYDDDGGAGTDSRIVFTATQTGNYRVDVRGYSTYTGDYHLLVNEDDYRGTVDGDGITFSTEGNGPVGSVVTGGSASGTTNYNGDADLFNPALVAGLTYTIELRGADSGGGSLQDPYLYLLDSGGNLLSYDDDSGAGLDSRIVYTSTSSGTHFLETHAFGNFNTGTYTISVSEGVGTAGADSIVAIGSHDAINGAGGNDTILGANGNDTLTGGSGNDLLRGQTGSDLLRGSAGADVLIGGTGNDVFDFNIASESAPGSRDIIRAGDSATAFQGAGTADGDRIDLSGIDANVNVSGDQAFIWGGSGAGHLSVTNSGTTTVVHGNIDGDAAFEFELVIEDSGVLASAYRAADFIL